MPDGGCLVRDLEVDIGFQRIFAGILVAEISNRREIRTNLPLLVRITHGVIEEAGNRVAPDDVDDARIELPDRSGPISRRGQRRELNRVLRRFYLHEKVSNEIE